MNKPKHIQLLEFLSDNNIGAAKNVSPWIALNFPIPIDYEKNKAAWNSQLFNIQSLLTDLLERKFIKYDYDGMNVVAFSPQYEGNWPQLIWYSDSKDIEFQNRFFLTTHGVDYLDKYHYSELSRELIASNKRTNSINSFFLILTFSISLFGAGISFLSYNTAKRSLDVSQDNSKSDSTNNENLLKRLDTLKEIIKSSKTELWLSKDHQSSHQR